MKGVVVWLTGLPSSGKSTLAKRVQESLVARGSPCCVLDSDVLRELLVPKPGYSEAARDDLYLVLARLAAELARQGLTVLVPATAHRREHRERARRLAPRFVEVWVDKPLEECRRRDAKGLYSASADVLQNLPGAGVSYEEPPAPEARVSGAEEDGGLGLVLRCLGE